MRFVSTPKMRAQWLRGALVGACSTVVTGGAHAAAGGGLPQGSALVLSGLVCAIVGALLAGTTLEGPRLRLRTVIGGLVAAQGLGHLVLSIAAGHHHGGLAASPSMVAAHLIGAVLLGAAITIVEYLYVVCVSLLCWLRVFATIGHRTTARTRPVVRRDVPALSVLCCAGLGMRAPPLAA